jgi:hypothetical protein
MNLWLGKGLKVALPVIFKRKGNFRSHFIIPLICECCCAIVHVSLDLCKTCYFEMFFKM